MRSILLLQVQMSKFTKTKSFMSTPALRLSCPPKEADEIRAFAAKIPEGGTFSPTTKTRHMGEKKSLI